MTTSANEYPIDWEAFPTINHAISSLVDTISRQSLLAGDGWLPMTITLRGDSVRYCVARPTTALELAGEWITRERDIASRTHALAFITVSPVLCGLSEDAQPFLHFTVSVHNDTDAIGFMIFCGAKAGTAKRIAIMDDLRKAATIFPLSLN